MRWGISWENMDIPCMVDLSERELIDLIPGILGKLPGYVISSPGREDAAVIKLGEDFLSICCDMLHHSTDFPPGISPYQMGWMGIASVLSDLAAMGSKPLGVMLSLGIPEMDPQLFSQILRGAADCGAKYAAPLIGGDLDRHSEITLVGIGIGISSRILPRSGVRPGDLVGITGALGLAGLGMKLLKSELELPPKLKSQCINALIQPVPKVNEAIKLAEIEGVHAMIDVSDGLYASLLDLGRASKLGFQIHPQPLLEMLDEYLRYDPKLDPLELICYGGDYQLLFSFDPQYADLISKLGFKIIGRAISEPRMLWGDLDFPRIMYDHGKR